MQVVSKIETGNSINRVGIRETGAACRGSMQPVDSANGGGAGAWNKETGDRLHQWGTADRKEQQHDKGDITV
jgi:hypothetical protein